MDAQGWIYDPFGVHEERWYSAGVPTALVRDHGIEGHDEPPDEPPWAPQVEPHVNEGPAAELATWLAAGGRPDLVLGFFGRWEYLRRLTLLVVPCSLGALLGLVLGDRAGAINPGYPMIFGAFVGILIGAAAVKILDRRRARRLRDQITDESGDYYPR